MSIRKQAWIAGGVLALGTTLFAHHVTQALSYMHGPRILSEIKLFHGSSADGVPPYVLSLEEHGHHDHFALSDGASFTLSDESGNSNTVTFHAADFVDISKATVDEVVDALNSQLTLAVASEGNAYFHLQGLRGGFTSRLSLADGPGSPLAVLKFGLGTQAGEEDVRLVISTPAPTQTVPDLSGLPYLVVASTTAGSTFMNGVEVPIAFDATTARVYRMTRLGYFGTFRGLLNSTGDAFAAFDTNLLGTVFPTGTPSKLYFAYVVMGPNGSVVYSSNRFTVNFEN
ncbi:MAG: hypothetical protein ACKVWV_05685 [Planctomycetota bacterium]